MWINININKKPINIVTRFYAHQVFLPRHLTPHSGCLWQSVLTLHFSQWAIINISVIASMENEKILPHWHWVRLSPQDPISMCLLPSKLIIQKSCVYGPFNFYICESVSLSIITIIIRWVIILLKRPLWKYHKLTAWDH